MVNGRRCHLPNAGVFDVLLVAAVGTAEDGLSFARLGAVPQPAVTRGALQVGGVGRGKSSRYAERVPGMI